VFVIDDDGEIVYDWVSDDPTNEPDYDAVLDAVERVERTRSIFFINR